MWNIRLQGIKLNVNQKLIFKLKLVEKILILAYKKYKDTGYLAKSMNNFWLLKVYGAILIILGII